MRFSVITVTRNNRAGLRRTAQSLKAQTCRAFEWIIIDGDSDDGTGDDLPLYDALAVSEPDHGIYDAMNKGMARAAGDYLLFLNAGDRLADAEILSAVASLPPQDFIYGDGREGSLVKRARPVTQILWSPLTYHQAIFYNRVTAGDLRYDTRYKIAADYKFTLQMLARGRSVLYWPHPVCVYEEGGLSQRAAGQARREMAMIRQELRLCGRARNEMIVAAQAGALILRRRFPALYRLWRGR